MPTIAFAERFALRARCPAKSSVDSWFSGSSRDLQRTLRFGQRSRAEGTLTDSAGLKEAKNQFEREFIMRKLKENDWNISRTAQVLGIERAHLHRKIKNLKISEAKES